MNDLVRAKDGMMPQKKVHSQEDNLEKESHKNYLKCVTILNKNLKTFFIIENNTHIANKILKSVRGLAV